MTTFITGDSSMTALYPGMVAIEMIRALSQGEAISTGSSETGVEALVRAVAREADLEIGVVPLTSREDGRPDWDARHAAVVAAEMHVVAIHADPQSSVVVRSLVRVVPEDELVLRTGELELL